LALELAKTVQIKLVL